MDFFGLNSLQSNTCVLYNGDTPMVSKVDMLIPIFPYFGHLYLSGMWLGEDLRTNSKTTCV